MFHNKPIAIFYLDRASATYFANTISPLTFTFPADSVRELEVVNEDSYSKELTNFIVTNKLVPSSIMIILAPSLLYEKEVMNDESQTSVKPEEIVSKEQQPTAAPAPQNVQAQQIPSQVIPQSDTPAISNNERIRQQVLTFLDIVPFEEVGSKTYKLDKGLKIIATNKRLFELVKKTFLKQGFSVEAIVPFPMLGKDIASQTTLTQDTAKMLLNKFDAMKQHSLMEDNPYLTQNAASENRHIQMTTKVTSKREYALIGVFVCLMLVLGGVTYMTFFTTQQPKKQIAAIRKKVKPTAAVTPVATISATPISSQSASLQKEAMRLQITGGTALQADLLKQQLTTAGYTNITTRPNNVPATGRALIVFTKDVDSTAREILLTEVRKTLFNVTVQENTLTNIDASINL